MVNRASPVARLLMAAMTFALVGASCTTASPEAETETPLTTTDATPGTSGPVTTTEPKSDFLAFVENSWNDLAIRSPEGLSQAGVSKLFGVRDNLLDDLSAEYVAETQALEIGTLAALMEFIPEELSDSERVTFGAYKWYLETQVAGHEFWLHEWPIHYFITSYNQGVLGLFTQVHPLTNLNQVDDFIARIGQIERQVDQVIANLKSAQDLGVFPPEYIVSDTIGQLRGDMAGERANRTAIYAALDTGLRDQGVNNATIADKLTLAEAAIEDSFFPAWKKLIAHMESIQGSGTPDIGLERLPDGDRFYQHKLGVHTSTSLSASDIHELGLREAERVQGELADLFAELGYPEGENQGNLRDRAAVEGGTVDGDEVEEQYGVLIDDAAVAFAPYFPNAPDAKLEVVSYPGQGAYYVSPAADGSRPGAFFTGTGGGQVRAYTMPTIAYHEAIPGHHFQISLAQEGDLPSVQRFITTAGFVEGWALYAERLASDIGIYKSDPLGDIGRLELELLRAARLVVDTGIHALGWSHSEAADAMAQIMGNNRYAHEIDRYVLYPGQATAYMVGMLTLLDLRDQLGASVDDVAGMAAFHDLALGSGNLPLTVLEEMVSQTVVEG